MTRILLYLVAIGLLSYGVAVGIPTYLKSRNAMIISGYRASDMFIRNQVLQLQGDRGFCTGVQVIAPSGHIYTLTAGHCKVLLSDNRLRATTEGGVTSVVTLIEEDKDSDLMLLTSDNNTGVFIASGVYEHEKVHTMTHGGRMPSYRTDGEALEIRHTSIPLFIVDEHNAMDCSGMPKLELVQYPTPFGITVPVCLLSTWQMYANAEVVPGSSGGPLLDPSGNLLGIVSATMGDGFSTFVTLSDIKVFLKAR